MTNIVKYPFLHVYRIIVYINKTEVGHITYDNIKPYGDITCTAYPVFGESVEYGTHEEAMKCLIEENLRFLDEYYNTVDDDEL